MSIMSILPNFNSSETTGSRVSMNAASSVIVMSLDMLISFFLLAFILSKITKETYGIWVIVGGVFAYSTMMQLGLRAAIDYYVPIHIAKNDQKGIDVLISTSLAFYRIISLIVVLASAILVIYFPSWFNIEAQDIGVSRLLVGLVGLYFTLAIPLAVYEGVLSGLQRYVLISGVRLVCRLSRAVFIISLLLLGCGILGLAISHVVSRLAEAFIMMPLARKHLPRLNISYKLASLRCFRGIVSYGIHALLWEVSSFIRDRASFVIIGVVLTTTAATLYSIPVMIILAISTLVQSFSLVTKPAASALMAEKNVDKIKEIMIRGSRYIFALILPITGFILLFGKSIILLWLGPDFTVVSGILNVLLISHVFLLGQSVVANVMIGIGQHRFMAYLAMILSFLSILLMVFFVLVIQNNLWGIALGTALPIVLLSFIILPIYICKIFELKFWKYWYALLIRPLLILGPFFLVLVLVKEIVNPTSFLSLLITFVLFLVSFVLGEYIWLLDESEKKFVNKLISRFRDRLILRSDSVNAPR